MAIVYSNFLLHFRQRSYLVISLMISWCLGILFGYLFYEPSFLSMMRCAVMQPVSIVGLFSCLFFPLLFSFLSVITNKPTIIMIVGFLKASSLGFSITILSELFATSTWLIRFLFLFSDSCFCIVLLVLWMRRFHHSIIQTYCDFFVCSMIGIGIAAVDIFVISPFLQGLL